MIGFDDPELMNFGDLPPAPPLSGAAAAEAVAAMRSLASDEEVEWLAARVLDDHGIARFPLAMDQVRVHAGVAASVRAVGPTVKWLRQMLTTGYGVETGPDPAVNEIKARLIDRACEMASSGWRPR